MSKFSEWWFKLPWWIAYIIEVLLLFTGVLGLCWILSLIPVAMWKTVWGELIVVALLAVWFLIWLYIIRKSKWWR